ncbi:EAL domain-containing protein, partial [Salmonella enterica subsp. enterica serovar Kentucky]|nr:EAL domain-containing protein [Salmonella enterica subsp. enterica serovar Kentucky]
DDFCTGHSSFKYIQQFAVDFLKIDKSFTHKYIKDDISRAIVNCIIGLAHKLNIKLIAEGIETERQAMEMTKQGVHYQQGYLYSFPVSEEHFMSEKFISRLT